MSNNIIMTRTVEIPTSRSALIEFMRSLPDFTDKDKIECWHDGNNPDRVTLERAYLATCPNGKCESCEDGQLVVVIDRGE